MKLILRLIFIPLLFLWSCGTKQKSNTIEKRFNQQYEDFNFDWRFHLTQDTTHGTPLVKAAFDDHSWMPINLPHDWSIAQPFDSVAGDGATGYLTGGVGYYRKTFDYDLKHDEQLFIHFDGVYNHSEVWINDHKLGYHPYGYSPFFYDLTDFLNEKGKNKIVVRVDHSRYIDSRWYTGSGIYRNVSLVKTKKLYVPIWGTFVTTPKVSKEQATIAIQTTVMNNDQAPKTFTLSFQYQDKSEVASPKDFSGQKIEAYTLKSGEKMVYNSKLTLEKPNLWSVANPHLYELSTIITAKGEAPVVSKTVFGIRSIHFDPNNGFTLNGENMKIKGMCLHHDGGLVGTAVPIGVWKRRLKTLKEAGCNAIRLAHNPVASNFLDLCDEMGFMVQNEFFDEWDNPKDKRLNQWERHDDYLSRGYAEQFQEYAQKDLEATMLRDRNHPSIIQWSIGNEIEWTYPRYKHASGYFNMNWKGNYFWEVPHISIEEIKKRYDEYGDQKYVLAKTAQKLSNWTKQIDTTRPVVANCILPSVSLLSGYGDALDVVGFSYRRVLYDYARENYPNKTVMGMENLGQWHEWKAIQERPFIAGTFLWTGIDYMGESHDSWPKKGTESGLLNSAGFPKGSYQMYKGLWKDTPHLHISTQTLPKSLYKIENGVLVGKKKDHWKTATWIWQKVNNHWNYKAKEQVVIEVYGNTDNAELFLNDKSLGKQVLKDIPDHIYKWVVPYEPGTLRVVGSKNGKKITSELKTARAAVQIVLTTDTKKIKADGYDVVHVVAEIQDEAGNPVRYNEKNITFKVQGDVKTLGVDNGSMRTVKTYQTNHILTHEGKSLLILQSKKEVKTTIKVSASFENESVIVKSDEISISVE